MDARKLAAETRETAFQARFAVLKAKMDARKPACPPSHPQVPSGAISSVAKVEPASKETLDAAFHARLAAYKAKWLPARAERRDWWETPQKIPLPSHLLPRAVPEAITPVADVEPASVMVSSPADSVAICTSTLECEPVASDLACEESDISNPSALVDLATECDRIEQGPEPEVKQSTPTIIETLKVWFVHTWATVKTKIWG